MKNSLVLLAVVLSVAAFAGMMRIKTDVQTMDRERMRLVRERAELRETKRVLEAEWALLASPDRLQRLVQGKPYVPASSLDVITLERTAVEKAAVVSATLASVTVPVSASAVVSDMLAAVVVSETGVGTAIGVVSGTKVSTTALGGAED